MKNILIIGEGSIGSLMGAALVKAGLKVTFAGKPGSDYTQKIKEDGLQLFYANRENCGFRHCIHELNLLITQQIEVFYFKF